MKDLLEDLQALPVIHKAENTWVGKKHVPVTIKLVELDKVVDLLKRNPVEDMIRDIITDLENLSNGYRAVSYENGKTDKTDYVIDKADLDLVIEQIEERLI